MSIAPRLAAINQVVPLTSAQDWAILISAAMRDSVAAIIRTGDLLAQAKAALPHGEFTAMVEDGLSLNIRTAQKFMAIAADPRLADAAIEPRLPPTWTTLYELSRLDDDTFHARLDDGTIRPDMERGEAIQGRMLARREERIAEMRALAENPLRLPGGPFLAGIIDPPWIDPDAPIGFTARHYGAQYPLMTPAEIAALPLGDIFGPIAFLALWITRHHLAIGSHLAPLAAWGFRANTILTWGKMRPGLGNGYLRDISEHVVLATRGTPPAPPPDRRQLSLFLQPRSSQHSAKPPHLHDWIESWFGAPQDSAYVELFQRGDDAREGWATFGNQASAGMAPRAPRRGALEFWAA